MTSLHLAQHPTLQTSSFQLFVSSFQATNYPSIFFPIVCFLFLNIQICLIVCFLFPYIQLILWKGEIPLPYPSPGPLLETTRNRPDALAGGHLRVETGDSGTTFCSNFDHGFGYSRGRGEGSGGARFEQIRPQFCNPRARGEGSVYNLLPFLCYPGGRGEGSGTQFRSKFGQYFSILDSQF